MAAFQAQQFGTGTSVRHQACSTQEWCLSVRKKYVKGTSQLRDSAVPPQRLWLLCKYNKHVQQRLWLLSKHSKPVRGQFGSSGLANRSMMSNKMRQSTWILQGSCQLMRREGKAVATTVAALQAQQACAGPVCIIGPRQQKVDVK